MYILFSLSTTHAQHDREPPPAVETRTTRDRIFLFPKIFTFSNRRALSLWTESPLSRRSGTVMCTRYTHRWRRGWWWVNVAPERKKCVYDINQARDGGGQESCTRARLTDSAAPRRKPPIKTRRRRFRTAHRNRSPV